MKKFLTQVALAASALLSVGAANAAVIDFDTNVDTSSATYLSMGINLMGSGDAIVQGNYFAQTSDYTGDSDPTILVAQLSNGSDATSCLNGACPGGAATHGQFLSVYDDGVVAFGKLDHSTLVFNSLSAAFIGAPSAPAGSSLYLGMEVDSGSNYTVYGWALNTSGAFQTYTAATAIKLSGNATVSFTQGVSTYFAYGYYCSGAGGNCTAGSSNLAQFAIDDVRFDVTAVPEPSEWMLMMLGLGAIGAAARRRRSI